MHSTSPRSPPRHLDVAAFVGGHSCTDLSPQRAWGRVGGQARGVWPAQASLGEARKEKRMRPHRGPVAVRGPHP